MPAPRSRRIIVNDRERGVSNSFTIPGFRDRIRNVGNRVLRPRATAIPQNGQPAGAARPGGGNRFRRAGR